eukprot:scaffold6096_cov39-Cyclotella_meneghiniana.AAC.8
MPSSREACGGNQARLKNGLRGVASLAELVPSLKHNSLISTSKLADANYHTVFTPTEVLVYDGELQVVKVPVWKGWRDNSTGMWRVPLINEVKNLNTDTAIMTEEQMQETFKNKIQSVHSLPSKEEAVKYLHAALGFPTKETMLAAVRAGFLTSWPGMNVKDVNKYFPESVETQKGHMRHQRKGLRSTKKPIVKPGVTEEDIAKLEAEKKAVRVKEKDFYVDIWDEKEIIYTDQTGQFPHTSSRKNKYPMVMYYIDGSYIMMEPMTSRKENEMIRAYKVLIGRLKERGFYPKKQMLDNEISKEYRKAIINQEIEPERVPKEAHRRNAAEKAIQIGKSHIKSCLAGCDPSFPMHLWDRLLPQMELTCNLVRPANANANVSAYQYLYGNHDYNRMPLHPMGCAVQAFIEPKTRRSWEEHSKDGWYLGTSSEHYCTYNIWIKQTRAVQNTDTCFFQHHYITKPKLTKADVVQNAATNLIEALKGSLAEVHNETEIEALQRLATIFEDATKRESGILEETGEVPRV